jgi:hypothetical protein
MDSSGRHLAAQSFRARILELKAATPVQSSEVLEPGRRA